MLLFVAEDSRYRERIAEVTVFVDSIDERLNYIKLLNSTPAAVFPILNVVVVP